MTVKCDFCDEISDIGESDNLPDGWIRRNTSFGPMNSCPICAPKPPQTSQTKSNFDFGDDDIVAPQALTETTKDKLRSYVARLENLDSEKEEIAAQTKDVYCDAKALGFDTKALRKVISHRKKDQKQRQEDEMMLDLYLHALGEI